MLGKCLKSAISEHRSSPNMRLFLNTWTLDGKYSLRNRDNYGNQFKCSYLRSKKKIRNFLLQFWNLHQILNILKKNMTLIGYVFPKLRTVKRAEINVLKVSSQNIVQKSTS